VTGGTPISTSGQTMYAGKSWLNNTFTSTGLQYSSATINVVSGITANDTNLTRGLTIRKAVTSSKSYNHGNSVGATSLVDFRGSGTSGAIQGITASSIYSGLGTSSGAVTGISGNSNYLGTNTITIANVQGVSGGAFVQSAGRATNVYGGSFTAQVASSGALNPTAGTVYGVRGDASHSSTGKTVDNMYAVYGLANATATGGTVTRIQGGFFQASVGNGTGGGTVHPLLTEVLKVGHISTKMALQAIHMVVYSLLLLMVQLRQRLRPYLVLFTIKVQ